MFVFFCERMNKRSLRTLVQARMISFICCNKQRLLNVLTRKYDFFTIIIKIDCAKCKIEVVFNIRYTVVSPSQIERF